jgi:putative transposase
VCQT